MIKRIILILTLVLVGYYLIYSFVAYDKQHMTQKCKDIIVEISNTAGQKFLSPDGIKEQVLRSDANPIGKSISDINTLKIEELVSKGNNYSKNVNVYITSNDIVKIIIKEKKPILRVISSSGKNYYLDEDGEKILLTEKHVTYIPVASGDIKDDSHVIEELYKFALFLKEEPFWNAQINQIYVNTDQEIQFITRVGNHLVTIGDTDNLNSKLNRLMTFYKKGLNKYGWNKYGKINLKFKNQVVCSKG